MAGESRGYLSGKLRNRKKLFRFFSYYGSKHGLVSKYPPPYYDEIIEPFAGSAGYSTLYWQKRIHLFDLDPVIVGLWKYLINISKAELLKIPIVNSWDASELNNWPEETRWLVGLNLCMGQPKPFNKQTSWAETRARSSWSEEVRFKLANQVDKIRHWTITHGDYHKSESIGKRTLFIDPPYIGAAGNKYNFGSSGIDYVELGRWCRSLSGQIIVTEGGNADWLPFDHLCYAHTSATRNKACEGNRSRELIYHQFDGVKV